MVRKSRKGREEWKIYKNVFDEHTKRRIFELTSQKYFKELKIPLALGKEANVFIAERYDGSKLIVKIYRLENRNFNTMFSYINTDSRFSGIENQKRKIIFSWVQREYRNLLLAREHIKVPTPIGFKDNILMMEYIGDDESAAPMVKDVYPENPEEFFKKVIKNMKKLIDAGLVHGDLSDFNILNFHEEPIFIDMSQSSLIKSRGAKELLERDLKNVFRAFRSIKINKEKVAKEVMDYFEKHTKDDE